MPQMAPMNWLMLMIYFSMLFMFFNSMNYFSFLYPSSTQAFKPSTSSISWKW